MQNTKPKTKPKTNRKSNGKFNMARDIYDGDWQGTYVKAESHPGKALALAVIEEAMKDAKSKQPEVNPLSAYQWLTTENPSLRFWCEMADLDITWVNETFRQNLTVPPSKADLDRRKEHMYIQLKRRKYESIRDTEGQRLWQLQVNPCASSGNPFSVPGGPDFDGEDSPAV